MISERDDFDSSSHSEINDRDQEDDNPQEKASEKYEKIAKKYDNMVKYEID